MTVDIAERFCSHAEDHHLGFAWKTSKVLGHLKDDRDAATLTKSFHVPAQRRSEACLVEHGWMENVAKCSNFLHRALHEIEGVQQVVAQIVSDRLIPRGRLQV